MSPVAQGLQVARELAAQPRMNLEREFGEDLAPQFALVVEGTEITGDLTRLVRSATFESALDIADCLTLELMNPGFMLTADPNLPPDLVSHKAFQPGNEVEIYGGYGRANTLIGRAILAKHLPRYPNDGVPTLSVKAYDKSYLLMNMEGIAAGGKETRVRKAAGDQGEPGTVWENLPAHGVVAAIAARWGLETDIDPVPVKPTEDGIVQAKGMSDYELLKTLANIHDRDFWIDWAPTNIPGPPVGGSQLAWFLHWKNPVRAGLPQCRFVYGNGDQSTLLSIEFEYGIRDAITEISVLAWDETSGAWISLLEVEVAMGPDPKWHPGGGTAARPTQGADPSGGGQAGKGTTDDALLTETLKSSTKFRMAAAGVAIDIVADRPFKSLEEAAFFAKVWFQKRKDQFIIARGRTVGVETLRHRQIHKIEGVGPRLSGDYQFLSVKHVFTVGGGDLPYTCEFTANRILE